MRIESTVPRVQSPTLQEFTERFLTPHKPVVICGTTDKWRARAAWTMDYLRLKIGSIPIRVKASQSNLHPDLFSSAARTPMDSTISQYIDLISSDSLDRNKFYLSGDEIRFLSEYTQCNPDLAPIFGDIAAPDYCPRDLINTIGFWLSAEGVVSSLHYDKDGSHNLNVQVKGKKRVLLFPPTQLLYPFSAIGPSRGPHNFSQVNILQPDETRFPTFRSASCFEAIIDEGDMLFIPSYWHHAVFHQGPLNINVNFWWQPDHFILTKTSLRAAFLTLVQSAATEKSRHPNHSQLNVPAMAPAATADTVRFLQKMEQLISSQYRF